MAYGNQPVLLRTLNRLATGTGLKRPLNAAAIIRSAERRTKLHDFGEPDVHAPLEILTRSLANEAELSLAGHIVTRGDLIHLLVNRLRLQADRMRHPEIGGERIDRPVFIIGLPRSGTSLLHELLAQDPAHRAPLTWEVRRPSPPPALTDSAHDPRVRKTARELAWFNRLNPRFKSIHPVGAFLPQECIEIFSHTFTSSRFSTTYFVPAYQRWLDARALTPTYAWHKRFLQHLQWRQEPRRWILKTPVHLFALDTLLRTYPDASIVQTHRDPATAMGSLLDMTAALQRVFSARRDRSRIAGEVARWAAAMEQAMQVRARAQAESATPFIDVAYTELASAPVETVERIYRELGLTLTSEARGNMRAWMAHHPQHRHGVHHYSLAEFGVDAEETAELFQGYLNAFDAPLTQARTQSTRQHDSSAT